MSNFSATIAPNRCVLANTGGTFIGIGNCQNGPCLRCRAARDFRRRAFNTPGAGNASCTCPREGRIASAADDRGRPGTDRDRRDRRDRDGRDRDRRDRDRRDRGRDRGFGFDSL